MDSQSLESVQVETNIFGKKIHVPQLLHYSPIRKNMLADLNPQELSESDDGEDYNAALMGQEHSDKQDFRKKSYSVISSVQR